MFAMYLFKFATLVLLVSLRFAEAKPVSYKDYNRFSNIISGNSQSLNNLNNKGFPIADNAGIQTPYLQDTTLTGIKSKLYDDDAIPSSLENAKRQMVEPVQPNNFYPNSMNEPNVNSYRGHWNGQVPLSQSNRSKRSNSDERNETVQGSIDHHRGSNPSFNEGNSDTPKETTQLSSKQGYNKSQDVGYEEVTSFPIVDESEVNDPITHFEDVFNENTSHSLVSENTMASNNQNFTLYPEYTNSLSDQRESSLTTDATNKNLNTMKDYQYTLSDDVDQYKHGNDGTDFVKAESTEATDEVVQTISKSEEKQIENGDEVSNNLFRNDEAYEYNGNYSENNGINENKLNESNFENYPFDDTNENPLLSPKGEDELNNEGVELDMSETASDDTALSTNVDYGEENYNGKNTLEEVNKGFTLEDNDEDEDMFEKEGTQGYDIDESTDDDRNEEIEDNLYPVDGDNIDSSLTGQDDIEHFVDKEMDTSLLDKDLAKLDVQNQSFSFLTFFVIFTFLIVFAMLYCGGLGKLSI